MINIEDKITENSLFFKDEEPNDGHENRFANRLENLSAKPRKRKSISLYVKIAAAFLILFVTSFLLLNIKISNNINNELFVTKIEYSTQLAQVQSYYDELVINKLNSIDELASSDNEAKRIKLKAQKSMDKLDANLSMIEKEYVKNPNNPQLAAAIVNNKKMKVKIVDNIINQLGDVQNTYHIGVEEVYF